MPLLSPRASICHVRFESKEKEEKEKRKKKNWHEKVVGVEGKKDRDRENKKELDPLVFIDRNAPVSTSSFEFFLYSLFFTIFIFYLSILSSSWPPFYSFESFSSILYDRAKFRSHLPRLVFILCEELRIGLHSRLSQDCSNRSNLFPPDQSIQSLKCHPTNPF